MVSLKAVFEDDYLIVFEKPPFFVVDNSDTKQRGTLEDLLKSRYKIKLQRSGIVHRLDKDTSGLLVVAKTDNCLKSLQHQFQERSVKKEYLSLVHGSVEKQGKVGVATGRNPANKQKFTILQDGKKALTEYQPISKLCLKDKSLVEIFPRKILSQLNVNNYNKFTLLRCQPQTGRTHQIRVHLKYINHPIVADEKYAGRKIVRLDLKWCPRQFLHAARLEFTHPATLSRMSFESTLPKDLKSVLGLLQTID